MSKNNPFCLSFGKEPDRYVERADAYSQITDTFNSISPASNCYMITGVRGIGKTVLLATIFNEYKEKLDWVAISLNPGRNLLEMFAASLYENAKLKKYFIDAELNLTKFGIGLNIKKNPPISDIQVALEKMIDIVNKKGLRILIAIDDVSKNKDVISFACAFQDWIYKRHQVFLLMTGLYENIYNLQRDKKCSFLLRAEKVNIGPLNLIGIKNLYAQTFGVNDEEAFEMAAFTKGYSYAFQALGYIMWDKDCSIKEAIPVFDEKMAGYCYEKIWEDLSEQERKIITLLAENKMMKVKDIITEIESTDKVFSVQRDRLVKKGVVDGTRYGILQLSLPRFDVFVKAKTYM